MNVLDRYFRNRAKSLIYYSQRRELYKKIRELERISNKYNDMANKDEVEVREMFNNGVFDNYKTMTDKAIDKLYQSKEPSK